MHSFTQPVLALAVVPLGVAFSCGFQLLSTFFSTSCCDVATILVSCAYFALGGSAFVLSGLLVYLALFLPVSRLHRTTASLLAHFFYVVYFRVVAFVYWRRFERATKQVRKEQDAILARMLQLNANTEYGRKMKFSEIKDRYEFRSKHPFCTYEFFSEYVGRMVSKGETNLITARDVSLFYVSSGTTGKPKVIPGVIRSENRRMEGNFTFHFLDYILPPTPSLAPLKTLKMFFTPRWRYSPYGMPIGSVSVYPPGYEIASLAHPRSTPDAAFVALPEAAQTHLHWLFALYDGELCRIETVFGESLVRALDNLAKTWQLLCEDVRNGRITDNSRLEIPDDVLEATKSYIWPDPERAREIEKEFKRGLEGVLSRIWPRIYIIHTAVTGAHIVFKERIRYFLGPKVQIYSDGYGSSEMGTGGVNLNHPYFTGREPDCSGGPEYFTLVPNSGAFFEFIPLTDDETDQIHLENPTNSVFMDELEIGRRYEIAISSDTCGFYRYRMGDIVKVVAFHNQAPQFEFCARVGSMLNLRGEKTTEDMVHNALLSCVATRWPNGKRLANFTATESVSLYKAIDGKEKYSQLFPAVDSGKLFYVLFVEVDGLERPLTDDENKEFDEELTSAATGLYTTRRRDNLVALPKVFVLQPGAFEAWTARTLEATEAVSTQYKTPRYVKTEESICFLLDHVIA